MEDFSPNAPVVSHKSPNAASSDALTNVLTVALQIPGVKVNRNQFLGSLFSKAHPDLLNEIIKFGPVAAGISEEELKQFSNKLILDRTTTSSIASFAMGIPGGLAMAASIPADTLQFFGMTLRMAQELAYIYGARDFWSNGELSPEAINGTLILYCGVMFAVSGATEGVRLLSSQIAKVTLKKLPQQALTKTVWYPIVKKVCSAIGVKITKSTVATGVSKAVPVIGGLVSGGLTFASMLPMGHRLADSLNEANFDYTEEEILADYETIMDVDSSDEETVPEPVQTQAFSPVRQATGIVSSGLASGAKAVGSAFSGLASKTRCLFTKPASPSASERVASEDPIELLRRLAELRDRGIVSSEEFDAKKADLLARL